MRAHDVRLYTFGVSRVSASANDVWLGADSSQRRSLGRRFGAFMPFLLSFARGKFAFRALSTNFQR
jgi:hypothetical protein